MTSVKRIEAGQYIADDGRYIVKDNSGWFVLDNNGNRELGPLPTLKSAKYYVSSGTVPLGEHNNSLTSHGRRQRKKEYISYLESEANAGNPLPAILYILALIAVCVFFWLVRGY